MADMLRITYYAEGHRNGCNSAREKESFLLNIARRDYPEVEWESAHTVEIHNA